MLFRVDIIDESCACKSATIIRDQRPIVVAVTWKKMIYNECMNYIVDEPYFGIDAPVIAIIVAYQSTTLNNLQNHIRVLLF